MFTLGGFPAVACVFDKGERYIEENKHGNSFGELLNLKG
jgi:hypothetical protein